MWKAISVDAGACHVCVQAITYAANEREREREIHARGRQSICPIKPSLQLWIWKGVVAVATHLDRLVKPIETPCFVCVYTVWIRSGTLLVPDTATRCVSNYSGVTVFRFEACCKQITVKQIRT